MEAKVLRAISPVVRAQTEGVFMLLRPGCGDPPACIPRLSRPGEIGASRPPGGDGDIDPYREGGPATLHRKTERITTQRAVLQTGRTSRETPTGGKKRGIAYRPAGGGLWLSGDSRSAKGDRCSAVGLLWCVSIGDLDGS